MRIDIERLCFGYGRGSEILHDVSLSLEGPGLVCIVGPNGVGKSTLIKCINGVLTPTSGRVSIDGTDVRDLGRKELALKVGYVPPKTEELFAMPVMDAVMIGRHNLQGWRNTEEDVARVASIMKLMDIDDLAMRPFNRLSSGQHQRVSIARGLAQETPVLLLDEPTSNLDVKHQIYVAEMLRGVADVMDKLIVMISHDLNIAAKYADDIAVMCEPGRVYAHGKPSDVITREMVREVYGVDCTIESHGGIPHVVLGSVLPSSNSILRNPTRVQQ